MSTTIKRIALVAVAALGLGVMSVAPSQAAANVVLAFDSGDSAGTDNTTGYGVAGALNYVTVKVIGTPGSDYVLTTTSSFLSRGTIGADSATITSDGKSITTVGAPTGTGIRVATPSVGTVTVSYFKRTNGALATTATESVAITVNASAQSGAYSAANSSTAVASGETSTMPTVDATPVAVATNNVDTAAATIKVTLKDALKAAYNDTVTATVISGSANVLVLLDSDSTTIGVDTPTSKATAGTVSSAKLTTNGIAYVLVYANGIAGPAQVKISLADGTVVATKTVTFSSTTVASITPTVKYALVSGDAGAPTNGTVGTTAASKAVTLLLKDSAGNVIPNNSAVTATTDVSTYISAVSCGTSDSTGTSTCAVTPVAGKYGATVITFAVGTVKATATVTTAATKATTLTVTAASTAAAGDLVTFTFTAKDASGNPIADGAYAPGAFIAKATSSATNYAFATTDTVTVKAGVATADVYAPYISGTWTTTWTLGGTAATTTAAAVGTDNVAAAIAGGTVTAKVAITNAGVDAATDAANEATDAANAATDAALAAADAADAATAAAQDASDAVAALATQVESLKAQIKTLTALVIKIQKKLKA